MNDLEVREAKVGYGRSVVLPNLTLDVGRESVTAVLGHNGAGKSTLVRAITGLLPVQSGSIHLFGEDITGLRPHERVKRGLAYVPQGQQSFGTLTTQENLQLVADGRKDGRAAMADVIDLFPVLGELSSRRAGLLSGGQRQQLAIARALITRPKLLVLDEPTEGIQPSVVEQIHDAIRGLVAEGGLSVLLVEQHVGFALNVAAKYYVLASGRVQSTGTGGQQQAAQVREALTI